MCAVSAVGDIYSHGWKHLPFNNDVSRLEFEALKKEVEEMKALLIKAKKYDEETGQPDCEMEEKVALLKKVADLVGVSLEDVFGKS